MDFKSAKTYLESLISYERFVNVNYNEENFNLERFRRFLRGYGVDYSSLKFVHVTGSKGKGTTCSFISQYLWKSGYKVGLYTSPHMFSITERFWLNGENIEEEKFAGYVADLKKFIESQEEDSEFRGLTFFELLTALALQFFVDEKVDYAVLEVGVGGRLDATNVVTPALSVLTTVELEHTEILGNTLEKILHEKLGIVKKGVPVLIGYQSEEAYRIINDKLAKHKETLYIGKIENNFDLEESGYDLARVKNARVAFAALQTLLGKVDVGLFQKIFEEFKFVGRFDIRQKNGKTLVFDMAHTENSMRNLIEALKAKFPVGKLVFLISVMKNKQVEAMLQLISEVGDRIWFTCGNKNRGHSGEELMEFYGKMIAADAGKMAFTNESWEEAFNQALEGLTKNEILIVTGSHYLVGKVLTKL